MEDCSMHRRLLAELLLQLSLHNQNFSSDRNSTPEASRGPSSDTSITATEDQPHHVLNEHKNGNTTNGYARHASPADVDTPAAGDADDNTPSLAAAPAAASAFSAFSASSASSAAAVASVSASVAPAENDNALVVVAATNRLEDLDEAVIRRFDAKVSVQNMPRSDFDKGHMN